MFFSCSVMRLVSSEIFEDNKDSSCALANHSVDYS